MPDEVPSFVERLKNRHVFRVAAMYAVTAWVLLQVGSVIFSPLGLPGWSQTALIILLAAGFPIALVLAWIYDATPDGIVKTVGDATPPTLSRGRRIDFVIIAMLVLALAMSLFWKPDERAPLPVTDASIAVLPFVAMSDDTNLRHLGDGIAEEITNQLAGRPNLEVASRTSAFQSHEGKDVTAIAQSLGVSYVLEGSVRPTGDLIRLTVQLVRAHDGFHVWSDSYDLESQRYAAQQDETVRTVSLIVVGQVELDLELQQARRETSNDAAFQHYAKARRLRMQINTGGTTQLMGVSRQIVDELDKAISLDPDFASAHGLRANAYRNRMVETVSWGEAEREARGSIERALALQPDKPYFLGQLASIQMQELDLSAAEQTLERIRKIEPDYRILSDYFATLAMQRGRVRDALQYWQQATERNPYDASPHYNYASLLRIEGDFDGAEREYDAAIRLSPRGLFEVISKQGRIRVALDRGDVDNAKAELEPLWAQYRIIFPQYFGYVLARLGHEAEARALVADMSRDTNAGPMSMFYAYYGLKDYDKALVWLRRAIDDHSPLLLPLVRIPNAFPGLQERPGYADILAHLDSIQRSP